MKKLFIISFFLISVSLFSQETKNIVIDLGATKHGRDIKNITFTIGAKSIVENFGVWGSFIGLDSDKSIQNSANGDTYYELSSYKGTVYGFGAGLNYRLPDLGLTFSAGSNFLRQKTITTYYNTSVTAAQNQATPYMGVNVNKIVTFRGFVDYDFLRKNNKIELGVRAGYDTYSSFEVGVFLGYKFTKT